MKKEYEKGMISIFIIFSMILLLLFVITSYFFVKEKIKLKEKENTELEKVYSKINGENNYASSNEIIPIYNIYEFNIAGTGNYLKIRNKIYQCGRGMSYIFKDNIIVDIDEDLMTKKIGFNDYKMYSQTYHIDTFSYDLQYYKDGEYWKNLVYKNFNVLDKNKDMEENNFSIIDKYEIPNESVFMIVWGNDSKLDNYDKIQNPNKNVNNINDIDVYTKNINNVNKENGEFYIFIKI